MGRSGPGCVMPGGSPGCPQQGHWQLLVQRYGTRGASAGPACTHCRSFPPHKASKKTVNTEALHQKKTFSWFRSRLNTHNWNCSRAFPSLGGQEGRHRRAWGISLHPNALVLQANRTRGRRAPTLRRAGSLVGHRCSPVPLFLQRCRSIFMLLISIK